MVGLLDSVFYEALPYGFLGLGLVLTFRYLRLIDLTFAATFAGAPAVAGALIVQGYPFTVALAGAAAFTLAASALTLFIMHVLEIDGLLAGLLTSLAGFSIALMFTQGTLSLHGAATPLTPFQDFDFHWLARGVPLHPAQVCLFALLLLAASAGVNRFLGSELGLAFRAMEDEKSRSALLASLGLSDRRMRSIGLVAGNLLCAASGLLVMLKEGQVTASRGFDAMITIIAAYLFGTILFERRLAQHSADRPVQRLIDRVAVLGPSAATICGILFYFFLLAIVLRTDLPSSTPKLLLVALVLAAFALTRWPDIRFRLRNRLGPRVETLAGGTGFSARAITVSYPGVAGPTTVLRDAAFDLQPGGLIQLVGENGSGKSTLLKYLAGQLPGIGRVAVPPRAAAASLAGIRQVVGYISQDAEMASCGTLSVAENLSLFANGNRPSPWRRWQAPSSEPLPPAVQKLTGSARDRPARSLSGGQRQALAIAAMIVRPRPPEIILFDEPLTHLDEANALACVMLIEVLAERGHPILLVQHDLGPALASTPSSARGRLAARLTGVLSIADIQDGHQPDGRRA